MKAREVLRRVFLAGLLVLAVAGAYVVGEMIDIFKRIG